MHRFGRRWVIDVFFAFIPAAAFSCTLPLMYVIHLRHVNLLRCKLGNRFLLSCHRCVVFIKITKLYNENNKNKMNEFRLMISIISLTVTIDSYLEIFLWLKYGAARFNLQHRQIMDYGMSYN